MSNKPNSRHFQAKTQANSKVASIKIFTASIITILALLAALIAPPALAQDENEKDHTIALKLFGENVIDGYDGCALSFWQDNRDPSSDKFAYVFFAPIHDSSQLPGWVKIGNDIREYERQDTSEGGYDYLAYHQLFKASSDSWMILEIKEQRREGNDILIDLAELTFVEPDKSPFTSVAKGKMGCPARMYEEVEAEQGATNKSSNSAPKTYTSLYGDPISLTLEQEFDGHSAVPKQILNYIAQNYASCDLDNPGYGARFAVSEQMSLWQVQCALYASNSTSNYFLAFNDNPDHFVALYANHPPDLIGFDDGDLKELLNPFVEPNSGHITASEVSNSGCGSFWRYALRAVEGETIEAFLVEYRSKQECDGNYIDPEKMPLIFEAK